MIIETDRLILRPWAEHDVSTFAKLHSDPVVMADQGGPIGESQSGEKLSRYIEGCLNYGYSRWCVETHNGDCVGYCGVTRVTRPHPLGVHDEIGWRLFPDYWSKGYATEAANASLKDVFRRTDLSEIHSYTAADNERSKAVMGRLGLVRKPSLDFNVADARLGRWYGLVWTAYRGQ